MVFAAELALRSGHLTEDVVRRHREVLASVGLPTSYPGGRWEDLLTAMRRDKKSRGARLRFVVLEGVGRPVRLEGPGPPGSRRFSALGRPDRPHPVPRPTCDRTEAPAGSPWTRLEAALVPLHPTSPRPRTTRSHSSTPTTTAASIDVGHPARRRSALGLLGVAGLFALSAAPPTHECSSSSRRLGVRVSRPRPVLVERDGDRPAGEVDGGVPVETCGPYPWDGSNGPTCWLLRLVRQTYLSSFGARATKRGRRPPVTYVADAPTVTREEGAACTVAGTRGSLLDVQQGSRTRTTAGHRRTRAPRLTTVFPGCSTAAGLTSIRGLHDHREATSPGQSSRRARSPSPRQPAEGYAAADYPQSAANLVRTR